MKPVIGIAPRLESKTPTVQVPEQLDKEEALARCFLNALLAQGALPIMLPLVEDEATLDAYLDMCDGIAIPGGQDVDPAFWGEKYALDPALLSPERDTFEMMLVKKVLERDLPLFTTCRGTQLLNVALGGTLCMDVPSYPKRKGMAGWRHEMIITSPAHPVEVVKDTLLDEVVDGQALLQVNSSHHCCVDKLGDGVVLSAVATDGVPECIELPAHRFVLGVQWHPEYTWEYIESDNALWRAFVDAARQTRK